MEDDKIRKVFTNKLILEKEEYIRLYNKLISNNQLFCFCCLGELESENSPFHCIKCHKSSSHDSPHLTCPCSFNELCQECSLSLNQKELEEVLTTSLLKKGTLLGITILFYILICLRAKNYILLVTLLLIGDISGYTWLFIEDPIYHLSRLLPSINLFPSFEQVYVVRLFCTVVTYFKCRAVPNVDIAMLVNPFHAGRVCYSYFFRQYQEEILGNKDISNQGIWIGRRSLVQLGPFARTGIPMMTDTFHYAIRINGTIYHLQGNPNKNEFSKAREEIILQNDERYNPINKGFDWEYFGKCDPKITIDYLTNFSKNLNQTYQYHLLAFIKPSKYMNCQSYCHKMLIKCMNISPLKGYWMMIRRFFLF